MSTETTKDTLPFTCTPAYDRADVYKRHDRYKTVTDTTQIGSSDARAYPWISTGSAIFL